MYLLLKAPVSSVATTAGNYTLCSLRSQLAANCSTHYNVTGSSSGFLSAYCEDPNDVNTYIHSQPLAANAQVYDKDWPDVVRQWALALSLNDGVLNANSSNARLLSQFVVPRQENQAPAYPPLRPSLAEALAVLSGCTLLISSIGAPFVHDWQYPTPALGYGKYQAFNASIQSQQYTSGFVQNYQAGFYIVLFLVFGTNVFCLIYFIIRRGLVTDFTEPENLFAIAINSPPCPALVGSCGGGPEGKELSVGWGIERHEQTGHYSIEQRLSDGIEYTTDTSYRGARVEAQASSRENPGSSWSVWSRKGQRLSSSSSYEMLSSKRKSYL